MGRKEKSKPTTLSEEYVVDSADEQDVAQSDRPRTARAKGEPDTAVKQRSNAKAQEHRKRKTPSSASESSSGSRSGEQDENEIEEEEDGDDHRDEEDEEGDSDGDGDESEVADLIDESSKHASLESSSRKERPRKKSKITYVFSCLLWAPVPILIDPSRSVRYHQSHLTHLQASRAELP